MSSNSIKIFIIFSMFFGIFQASMYARRKTPSERLLSVIRPKGYQHRLKNSLIQKSTVQLNPNRPLPCCKDESGGSICKNMKRQDAKLFAQKCQLEPDFSLVVCCNSCSEAGISYRKRAASFFAAKGNSTNCFDRMSPSYCSRFENGDDGWNNRKWSCDTTHFRLGFRVCRSACGFCTLDWENAPDPVKCF